MERLNVGAIVAVKSSGFNGLINSCDGLKYSVSRHHRKGHPGYFSRAELIYSTIHAIPEIVGTTYMPTKRKQEYRRFATAGVVNQCAP